MLVFQLTGSGLKVSGMVIAEILPVLLLAPIAGAVADRLPRIGVMVAADLWRAGLAALLPVASHNLAAVYAIAFGLSAGGVFFNPASASVLPAIVSEDELIAANSGLWSAAVVSQIALAPLAGAMVAAWGVAPAFYVNAATFAFSTLILARLRLPNASPPSAVRSWASGVLDGGRLLIGDRLLAAVQLLAALSAGATSALLVVLAERHLRTGPGGLGLLLGASGAGAALGPLLLARLTSSPRRPALVFGPYLLRGIVDLILAATRSLPAAMGRPGPVRSRYLHRHGHLQLPPASRDRPRNPRTGVRRIRHDLADRAASLPRPRRDRRGRPRHPGRLRPAPARRHHRLLRPSDEVIGRHTSSGGLRVLRDNGFATVQAEGAPRPHAMDSVPLQCPLSRHDRVFHLRPSGRGHGRPPGRAGGSECIWRWKLITERDDAGDLPVVVHHPLPIARVRVGSSVLVAPRRSI